MIATVENQMNTTILENDFIQDSPIREHYGELMIAVDEVIERDSFDDRPLRSLKNLCMAGAIGEGLKWSWENFLRFHREIENHLKKIVFSGVMFEPDLWTEDKLQYLLERHHKMVLMMSLNPS